MSVAYLNSSLNVHVTIVAGGGAEPEGDDFPLQHRGRQVRAEEIRRVRGVLRQGRRRREGEQGRLQGEAGR